MSQTLIALEEEAFPHRIRWTVEECNRLVADGYLKDHYELIDGEIISKMGQNPPHSVTLVLLAEWLMMVFGLRFVRVQSTITLPHQEGIYNQPEPDLAVTRESTLAYTSHHPAPDDLLLVVEVSDTTLRFDLTTKARLYARAGITEYWTLDLPSRQLHIHRDPVNGEYASVTLHAETESVSTLAHPQQSVRIADLLPPVQDTAENA